MAPQPTREDKFRPGPSGPSAASRKDMFGEAARPVLADVGPSTELAEIGAYGITFRDDDVIPPSSGPGQRRIIDPSFCAGVGRAGTCGRWYHELVRRSEVFKTAASPAMTDRSPACVRKVMRNMDRTRPSSVPRSTCSGVARKAPKSTSGGRTRRPGRYREALDTPRYRRPGLRARFAIRPSWRATRHHRFLRLAMPWSIKWARACRAWSV